MHVRSLGIGREVDTDSWVIGPLGTTRTRGLSVAFDLVDSSTIRLVIQAISVP